MADTIVSAPGRTDTSDMVVGWVIAAVIALALFIGVIALFRNTPAPQSAMPSATVETTIPTTGTAGN